MPPDKASHTDEVLESVIKRFEKALHDLKDLMDERDRRYEERFISLKEQSPTATEHIALAAKVEALESSKDVLQGKASQSSVQILLWIAVGGMLISLCAAVVAASSLVLHLFGIV
jgi:hypothetical protein